MYKKWLLFILSALAVLLSLTACNERKGQNYILVEVIGSISSIEIVQVGEISTAYLEDRELEVQTTLAVVEDIEGFCEDFRNLDAGWAGMELFSIMDDVSAIKIIYNNGDYALVHWLGTSRCRDGSFRYYGGTHFYDEDEFKAIIAKYIEIENFPGAE